MKFHLCLWTAYAMLLCLSGSHAVDNEDTNRHQRFYDWDPKGYVMFCLCMGRFGNQAEHFLGAMAFAKKLNRTLVLPQFRFHDHRRFSDLFKLEVIEEYHKVIETEDFMEQLAPDLWPPSKRVGMCWSIGGVNSKEYGDCKMKDGMPFKAYWDGVGIDFVREVTYSLSYDDSPSRWEQIYPTEQFPVYAMRGAPASFPVQPENRDLQRYLEFTDNIRAFGDKYIAENFPGKKYIGIHLRNGYDWDGVCDTGVGLKNYMASPQCLDGDRKITQDMCSASPKHVTSKVKKVVLETGAKVVFVATDKLSYKYEIERFLKDQKVQVFHMDPEFPVHDVYMLTRSDYFIGHCVSSFTAFVKRHRDVHNLPSAFFGLD